MEQAMHDLPGFRKFSKYVRLSVTGEGPRIELLEKEGGLFFDSGSSEIRGYADLLILIPSDPTDSRNRRISVIMKYVGQ